MSLKQLFVMIVRLPVSSINSGSGSVLAAFLYERKIGDDFGGIYVAGYSRK